MAPHFFCTHDIHTTTVYTAVTKIASMTQQAGKWGSLLHPVDIPKQPDPKNPNFCNSIYDISTQRCH